MAPRGLRVAAIVVFAGFVLAIVLAAASSGTLGYDFLAYHQAASRVVAGERLYDPAVQQTGGFGLFYYPPPFVLAILPLVPFDGSTAVVIWTGLMVAALVAGIAVMPVTAGVRWVTLLLAGLSWPVAYAIKLGQVGPLLLLLFAIGWRFLDSPVRLGGSAAVGALVKLQPGLVLGWAVLTRRWRAVAVGIAVIAVASVIATLVAGGTAVWADYIALIRNVSDPITTPHNFTPGAVLYRLGVAAAAAAAVQAVTSVLVVVALFVAIRATSGAASYLATIVASQLLSPVLWDHYALILLLPTAWLLERGRRWAVVIPLATSTLLVPFTPPAAYPVAFALTLVAIVAVARREAIMSPRPSPADAGPLVTAS